MTPTPTADDVRALLHRDFDPRSLDAADCSARLMLLAKGVLSAAGYERTLEVIEQAADAFGAAAVAAPLFLIVERLDALGRGTPFPQSVEGRYQLKPGVLTYANWVKPHEARVLAVSARALDRRIAAELDAPRVSIFESESHLHGLVDRDAIRSASAVPVAPSSDEVGL